MTHHTHTTPAAGMTVALSDLHKKFGKNEVLQGIDHTFVPGRISAVLGPNGCGKSTLIKSILGLVIPDKGDIYVDGQSVLRAHAYKKDIDYVAQIARFPDNLTGRELIRFVKTLRNGNTREDDLIRLFDMSESLDKKIRHLSGGTRQKINLIQALMFDSPVVILDEPTAGLDPVSVLRFKEWILNEKKNGKTILITTHVLGLVEALAEDVVYLIHGKVQYSGPLEHLLKQYQESHLEQTIARMLQENLAAQNGHTIGQTTFSQ